MLLLPLLLLALLAGTRGFLLVVPASLPVGSRLVDAELPELGPRRLYRLAAERSAPFLPSLLRVDALDGRVYLKQPIDCSGVRYPHLFSLHIECVTLGHVGDVPKDYHSLAFRVLLACPEALRLPSGESLHVLHVLYGLCPH